MTMVRRTLHRGHRMRIKYDANNPEAIAQCDGCGLPTMHKDLRQDMQFRGGVAPVWTGWLVCGRCQDVPNVQLARQVLPPDPIPVKNPRPITGTDVEFLATENDDPIVTEDGDLIEADQ